MKTKIIPFDLETAKKIQAGEIDGKIKTRCGYTARILCTDLVQAQPILAAFATHELESVSQYTKRGCFYINGKSHEYDLILEVPDNEPQFKPFDKVLVRYPDKTELWVSKHIWFRQLLCTRNNIKTGACRRTIQVR